MFCRFCTGMRIFVHSGDPRRWQWTCKRCRCGNRKWRSWRVTQTAHSPAPEPTVELDRWYLNKLLQSYNNFWQILKLFYQCHHNVTQIRTLTYIGVGVFACFLVISSRRGKMFAVNDSDWDVVRKAQKRKSAKSVLELTNPGNPIILWNPIQFIVESYCHILAYRCKGWILAHFYSVNGVCKPIWFSSGVDLHHGFTISENDTLRGRHSLTTENFKTTWDSSFALLVTPRQH